MNLDQLNKWLTLVANLGVVAGFVLLALQLGQNTEAIRLQNAREQQRDSAAADIAYMGDTTYAAFAVAITKPAELTLAQMGQVWSFWAVGLRAALNTWVAYHAGYASDEAWKQARRDAMQYVDSGVGRVIWKETKTTVPPQFAKEIDRELASGEERRIERQWRGIMDGIRALPPTLVVKEN